MLDEAILIEMLDRQKISDLIAKYFLCIDEKNFSVMKQIFTDDAHIKMPMFRPFKGANDIARTHAGVLSEFESTHHVSGGLIFNFKDAFNAEIKCPVSSWRKYKNGTGFLITRDLHTYSFKKINDEWRIIELTITCIYRKDDEA